MDKMIAITLQMIVASLVLGSICESKVEKRVIGGEIAPIDKYHWSVSIKGNIDKYKASGACGASILKTKGDIQWFITAAHCFYPSLGMQLLNPKDWHARIGLRNVDFTYEKHGFGKVVKDKMKYFFNKVYRKMFGKDKFKITLKDVHIKKIIIHPNYKHPILENDIALMKIVDPLPVDEMKTVDTIELPDEHTNTSWPEENAQCLVVGWGCTKAGGKPNPKAKLAFLNIWNNTKCQSAFKGNFGLNPETEFCAGFFFKEYGLCPGDSGSGLACEHQGKWKIAGIVSAAHRRNPGQFPAIFTRVSSFRNWILETIRANE